jgi:hypothetical protein
LSVPAELSAASIGRFWVNLDGPTVEAGNLTEARFVGHWDRAVGPVW